LGRGLDGIYIFALGRFEVNICMIGIGYVGLVTGTCLAESGNDVICADIDAKKVSLLKQGKVPIYEPGLGTLINRNVKEKRLTFTTDLVRAVKGSLIIFIAVGTPPHRDGSPNLNHVFEVARGIGRAMNGYKIVVTKSTVPVGTTENVKMIIAKETKYPSGIASNPEFLKEGAAIDDFMRPDRIILGVEDSGVEEVMKELYTPFVRTGNPIITMEIRSAEMTKYASNAMLATRISFMNELANLCEDLGADINAVRTGIASDPRIGSSFLFPGVGYGGSCFPKDVQAMIKTAEKHNRILNVLPAVEAVNQKQRKLLAEKVIKRFKKDLKNRTIAVWGLSFKPNTDDMREAPSIVIINKLLKRGAKIKAYDPVAIPNAKNEFGNRISYGKDNYDVLSGADALMVITEWNEFRRPNFEKMLNLMKFPIIFDGRNIFPFRKLKKLGFEHYGIGC
jgi:UDPglucose 6-dehydrogenase